MSSGLVGLILVLILVVSIIATKKTVAMFTVISLIACIYISKYAFLQTWVQALEDAVVYYVDLLLMLGLFGSMIRLLTVSKGINGFASVLNRICKTDNITKFATHIFGIIIFIDDYLNILSVTTCMRPIWDKRKMPREGLAYVVDTTAAPVAILVPVASWAIFLGSIFYEQPYVAGLGYGNAFSSYVHCIPFIFYPLILMVVTFLFDFNVLPPIGGMKKAWLRAKEEGKVYSYESAKFNKMGEERIEEGNIWNFIIPMGITIIGCFATQKIVASVIAGILIAIVMFVWVPGTRFMSSFEFFEAVAHGFGDMMPILVQLIVTFQLQMILDKMHFTEWVIEKAEPYMMGTASFFPAVVFILVSFLTFTTGSLWGMCALATPIVFPLATLAGANPLLTMAAIASGGGFGSHACFYSDATLLTSDQCRINNIEHFTSQLPYVGITFVLALALHLVTGFAL